MVFRGRGWGIRNLIHSKCDRKLYKSERICSCWLSKLLFCCFLLSLYTVTRVLIPGLCFLVRGEGLTLETQISTTFNNFVSKSRTNNNTEIYAECSIATTHKTFRLLPFCFLGAEKFWLFFEVQENCDLRGLLFVVLWFFYYTNLLGRRNSLFVINQTNTHRDPHFYINTVYLFLSRNT